MPILPVNPLHTALGKGPGFPPGAHGLSWLNNHAAPHGGHAGGGFPLGFGGHPGGGADRAGPGWNGGNGHPGQGGPGQVGHGHPGQGLPGIGNPDRPGQGTPGHVHPGHPGQGIQGPSHPGQGVHAPGHPGHGLVRDILGLPHHAPSQAGTQAAQLAMPTLPPGHAGTVAHPGPAGHAGHAGHAQAASAAIPAGVPAVVQMPAGASTHAPGAMQPAQAQQATPPAPPATSGHTRPEMAPPVAARADVAPPRADGTMLPRSTSAPVTNAHTPPPAAPASTATTAAAASAAALAAGNTLATAPAAPAAVQAQVVEARSGNPMVVADRGQVIARTDIAGTYTGEGPHRRRLQRAGHALPGGLATLLAAFGAQGHTAAGNRDPAAVERELRDTMMQWLFWLLAIIAYGCVAFAIIALMPMGSGPVGNAAPRAATGGFALLGLLSAAAAWLLARRLATRSRD